MKLTLLGFKDFALNLHLKQQQQDFASHSQSHFFVLFHCIKIQNSILMRKLLSLNKHLVNLAISISTNKVLTLYKFAFELSYELKVYLAAKQDVCMSNL